MIYPDLELLTLQVLAAAGIEPLAGRCEDPDCEECEIFNNHYCAVRDVLQAALDEAMKPDTPLKDFKPDTPPAPVPALERESDLARAVRLVEEAGALLDKARRLQAEQAARLDALETKGATFADRVFQGDPNPPPGCVGFGDLLEPDDEPGPAEKGAENA